MYTVNYLNYNLSFCLDKLTQAASRNRDIQEESRDTQPFEIV